MRIYEMLLHNVNKHNIITEGRILMTIMHTDTEKELCKHSMVYRSKVHRQMQRTCINIT